MNAMEILQPGTDAHAKVLKMLNDRLELSEKKMSEFYPRWRVNERKVQAYIDLPNYEKLLQEGNDKGAPPKIVNISIPYSFAVIQTVVTYLLHTFCGRQPIFQVGSYKGEDATKARNLEIMMQFNADRTRLILQIYEMLFTSQVYQFGVVRVGWQDEYRMRTVKKPMPQFSLGGMQLPGEVKVREKVLTYSGNVVDCIDPFLFFPDPNVPMTRVNRDGDFTFWRAFKSHTWLREMEAMGVFKNTASVNTQMPRNERAGDSDRSRRSLGDGIAGQDNTESQTTIKMRQIDEGTVKIIPSELGLGDSSWPETWLFTWVNKQHIVRAEPLEADHDLHPVAVIEPMAIGAQFGALSMADIVGPVQDHITWLINSHMQNVRGVINNRLVVNPHYVHMEDLKKDPSSGEDGSWILRMKQSAFGVKPDQGVYQLAVQDVTSGNLKNVEMMIKIGHMFAGVNENLMGLQDSSGRKTATEVRTSGEAGASRLAALARIASAQGLSDVPYMMGKNLQQRVDPNFYSRLMGQKGMEGMVIDGDFYYPINDGTLPLDRAMLLGVWQQILMGVAQDPQLRQVYSLPELFRFVADLGGARNIDQFKVQVQPDAAIEGQLANGNIMPVVPGMGQPA